MTYHQYLGVVLAGGVAGTLAASLTAQQPAPPLTMKQLKPDVWVGLGGAGGNSTIIVGKTSVIIVDAKTNGAGAKALLAEVAKITPKPVTTAIITHSDGDHVNGLAAFPPGIKIIAHENVKKRLSVKVNSEALGRSFDPLKPEGLPAETFTKSGKLTFGKQEIDYTHFADGHTDGDAYLFLPKANVLHTGDLMFSGMYPVIDYSTGGWIGGMAAACDTMLRVGDAKTRVIPGHGALASKDDLRASRDMLHTVHERLAAMAKQGKTVEEVLAAAPTKDLDEQWGKARPAAGFVRQAYTSLLHRNHTT